MDLEVKNAIKAEIADLKENLNGQQEKLTHLLEILEKEEGGSVSSSQEVNASTEASGFDIKINGVSRKDIKLEELKATLESLHELTHAKHPEIELTITDVESETNEPVTLTNQQIGKGMRYDGSIAILDVTKRLIGDIKIEYSEQGIESMRAHYYKVFWKSK